MPSPRLGARALLRALTCAQGQIGGFAFSTAAGFLSDETHETVSKTEKPGFGVAGGADDGKERKGMSNRSRRL